MYFKINAIFKIKGLTSAMMYFGTAVCRENLRVYVAVDLEKGWSSSMIFSSLKIPKE